MPSTYIYMDPEWVAQVRDGKVSGVDPTKIREDATGLSFIRASGLPTSPTFTPDTPLEPGRVTRVVVRDTLDDPADFITQGLYRRGGTRAQVKNSREYGYQDHGGYYVQNVEISGRTLRSVKDFIARLYAGELEPYKRWEGTPAPSDEEEPEDVAA